MHQVCIYTSALIQLEDRAVSSRFRIFFVDCRWPAKLGDVTVGELSDKAIEDTHLVLYFAFEKHPCHLNIPYDWW